MGLDDNRSLSSVRSQQSYQNLQTLRMQALNRKNQSSSTAAGGDASYNPADRNSSDSQPDNLIAEITSGV